MLLLALMQTNYLAFFLVSMDYNSLIVEEIHENIAKVLSESNYVNELELEFDIISKNEAIFTDNLIHISIDSCKKESVVYECKRILDSYIDSKRGLNESSIKCHLIEQRIKIFSENLIKSIYNEAIATAVKTKKAINAFASGLVEDCYEESLKTTENNRILLKTEEFHSKYGSRKRCQSCSSIDYRRKFGEYSRNKLNNLNLLKLKKEKGVHNSMPSLFRYETKHALKYELSKTERIENFGEEVINELIKETFNNIAFQTKTINNYSLNLSKIIFKEAQEDLKRQNYIKTNFNELRFLINSVIDAKLVIYALIMILHGYRFKKKVFFVLEN